MAKECKHTTVVWIPVDTDQGEALVCYCQLCGEITDVMHEDEGVYWKDPLPEDEPEDESPRDWS